MRIIVNMSRAARTLLHVAAKSVRRRSTWTSTTCPRTHLRISGSIRPGRWTRPARVLAPPTTTPKS